MKGYANPFLTKKQIAKREERKALGPFNQYGLYRTEPKKKQDRVETPKHASQGSLCDVPWRISLTGKIKNLEERRLAEQRAYAAHKAMHEELRRQARIQLGLPV